MGLAQSSAGRSAHSPVRCDVTEWATSRRWSAAALDAFGRIDVVFANAGFGAKRGFLESTPGALARDGPDQRLRRRAHRPRDAAAARGVRGPPAADGLGRRPARAAGSLYSSTKWAITAMGEAARQEVDGTGVRVTLIEPGMVDTPFFDNRPRARSSADDIARAVMFAVSQPPHVDVNEILIRPTAQPPERRLSSLSAPPQAGRLRGRCNSHA